MRCDCSAALPGESLATVRADVGFFHTALVRAHMVAHAVLPLEALLADGTGERFLVRVGQAVAVEVVDVSEGLPTCLAGVVLPHGIWVGICGPLRQKQADEQATEFRFEEFPHGIYSNYTTTYCQPFNIPLFLLKPCKCTQITGRLRN